MVSDVQLAGDAEGLKLLDGMPPDGPAVLLLSSYDQPPLIRSAFERGAAGYLIKTSQVAEILDAVRTVAAGGTAFSAAMLRAIRSAPRRPSDREIEVLGAAVRRGLERRDRVAAGRDREDGREPPAPAVRPVRGAVAHGAGGARAARGMGGGEGLRVTHAFRVAWVATTVLVVGSLLLRLVVPFGPRPPTPRTYVPHLWAIAALVVVALAQSWAPTLAWVALVVGSSASALAASGLIRELREAEPGEEPALLLGAPGRSRR